LARRPRINFAGFHHIINRGVARTNIYLNRFDKEEFLKILCNACETYKVNLHDYCLMDNHYHLLVELTQENLSLFMRQLNSNYAIYFNKKYSRSGHLWQGRYKSYYVYDENYLFMLYRYIEQNPIKAKISKVIGEYEFTFLATLLNNNLDIIDCAKRSQLKNLIQEDGILEHFELTLSENDFVRIQQAQKREINIKEHELKLSKTKTLDEHFEDIENERNIPIINAIDDGYTQASIAKYLSMSTSSISKIIRKYKLINTDTNK